MPLGSTMATEPRDPAAAVQAGANQSGRRAVLELVFIAAVGIVVLAALISSLQYDMISARAPLCILAPLLLLTGFHLNRARKAVRAEDVRREFLSLVQGGSREFNSSVVLMGWMSFLLAAIYAVGHYFGMVVFMFLLLRFAAREPAGLSLGVSAGVTLITYLLFEHVFNIELYRGLLLDVVLARII